MKLVTATLGVSEIQSWSVTLVPSPVFPIGKPETPHSTPPPSIQVPTSVHSHSQLEWSTCLGVSFYSRPCVWSPKSETGVSLLEIHVYHLGVCVSCVCYFKHLLAQR